MTWDHFTHSEALVSVWRKFRKSNVEFSPNKQLENVAEFFKSAPMGARSLDFYTPESWPGPWELLHSNTFCQSSTSLLMYYTLQLMPNFDLTVKLILIDDAEDRYLIPLVDNKYILNYELGFVSEWQTHKNKFKIIEQFTKEQIKQVV